MEELFPHFDKRTVPRWTGQEKAGQAACNSPRKKAAYSFNPATVWGALVATQHQVLGLVSQRVRRRRFFGGEASRALDPTEIQRARSGFPVTTRIRTFVVGNPYTPSFVTVTGSGMGITQNISHLWNRETHLLNHLGRKTARRRLSKLLFDICCWSVKFFSEDVNFLFQGNKGKPRKWLVVVHPGTNGPWKMMVLESWNWFLFFKYGPVWGLCVSMLVFGGVFANHNNDSYLVCQDVFPFNCIWRDAKHDMTAMWVLI